MLDLVAELIQQGATCAPLAVVERQLHADFGEVPMIEWEDGSGRTVRLLSNVQTGTVTVLLLSQMGNIPVACMVGSGEKMRVAPQFKSMGTPAMKELQQ